MNTLLNYSQLIFSQLVETLHQLTDAEYALMMPLLSGASLGQHTRHVLEFYQCLATGFDKQEFCYDHRQRNLLLEGDRRFALSFLAQLTSLFDELKNEKTNKPITLIVNNLGENMPLSTSLERELHYCTEHAIHHLAIIKIAINAVFSHIKIAPDFGVAPSTIQYRENFKHQTI